jgi:hypothetical protein
MYLKSFTKLKMETGLEWQDEPGRGRKKGDSPMEDA